MKWKTHIAIAKAIARALRLQKDLEYTLSQGSIEPDKHPDNVWRLGRRGRAYKARAPHHNPDLGVIMKHIWNARLAYLRGDSVQAVTSLGKALHYIQDKTVSRGFFGLSHNSREEKVAHQTISQDTIEKGIKSAMCSPHYVNKTIRGIKPKKNPKAVVNQACVSSAAIAKAVLGDKTPSRELVAGFNSAKERHCKRTVPLAIGAFGLISIASVITQNVLYLLLGFFCGYIIQRLDVKYHYLKEEAKWFGIKI